MSELKLESVKLVEAPTHERAEWASPKMRIINLSKSELGFTIASADAFTSS